MKTVGIHEAKTNLSRLIEKACRGEEIIIARGSRALCRPRADRRGSEPAGDLDCFSQV